EAKEPMSITAVSPESIVSENFSDSMFWHKLENLLLVYYHYDSDKTVKSWEYCKFKIKGYEFHKFSKEDEDRLKKDWLKVQEFIRSAQKYCKNPEDRYPQLGSTLRKNLMLIDTAPKWPHRPRFRLKRSTVTAIIRSYFGKKYDTLPQSYSSFDDIDSKLSDLTLKYSGKTIEELLNIFRLSDSPNKKSKKAIAEEIVVKMFGGKAKKLNKIEVFDKTGLTLKTLTQTATGLRTEDTKLFQINFNDLTSEDIFENSQFFSYFSERQFLFILFEEPSNNATLLKNKFLGFKRLTFSDDFIDKYVRNVWTHTRNLILKNKLREYFVYKNGKAVVNKTGIKKTKLNFLKSASSPVFLRGSGNNSLKKPLVLNNIHMYNQWIWIRGRTLVELLSKEKFI
ncbi:MutH/Sau3AI family endonuclease, partial [Liquorilactobacillus mali]